MKLTRVNGLVTQLFFKGYIFTYLGENLVAIKNHNLKVISSEAMAQHISYICKGRKSNLDCILGLDDYHPCSPSILEAIAIDAFQERTEI